MQVRWRGELAKHGPMDSENRYTIEKTGELYTSPVFTDESYTVDEYNCGKEEAKYFKFDALAVLEAHRDANFAGRDHRFPVGTFILDETVVFQLYCYCGNNIDDKGDENFRWADFNQMYLIDVLRMWN